jgi:hypothetical protein
MFERLRSLLGQPKPAGPPQTLRSFGPSDKPIAESGLAVDEGAWRVEARANQTVRLFEVDELDLEKCLLTYRARLKAADLQGRAYLEMWCRLPGRGEFFSKGLQDVVTGTTDWGSYEVPFRLAQGQRPDLVKLNVAVEGAGTVWIKDVELLQTPLR